MNGNPDYYEMRKRLKKLNTVAEILQAQCGDESIDLTVDGLEGLGHIVEGITGELREICGVPPD